MWMKTIQQDLKSNNLSLNEATGLESSSLETDVYVWCYAPLVRRRRRRSSRTESRGHNRSICGAFDD